MAKPKTRRMRVKADGLVQASPSWADSTITVRNWDGDEWKEAIITISAPWQMKYIRRELNKIEQRWNEMLRDI